MDPNLFKTAQSTPATLGVGPLSYNNIDWGAINFKSTATPAPSTTNAPATPAPKPVDQSGFTPSGLFINSDGTVNLERSLTEAQKRASEIAKGVQQLQQQQAPTTNTQGVVSSSDSVVADENNTRKDIANLSVPSPSEAEARAASEAYLKVLDDEYKALEERRKREVEQIEKDFEITKGKTEDAQKRESGTTNVALQRVGGYLGTQISAVGVLNNLAQTHRAEISALESKKAAAVAAANSAINDKQFSIAKLKAQEAKDISKEINDRRNKFFDQSMEIIREQRQQDAEERQQRKDAFDRALDSIDRIGPTIVESIEGMDDASARNFILGAAKDLRLDPNLLIGEVNSILSERRDKERTQIYELAKKYPSANIDPGSDTFVSASDKVRGSKEYKIDIAKAEADLTNTRSLIQSRASDASINYSDPILKMYTQATGEIVSSPSKARAIMGYADSLLEGKEVVADDYGGALLDNQIKASDARRLVQDSFSTLPKDNDYGVLPEGMVNQWLATPEAQAMEDSEKASYIRQAGHNPEDFGVYD